MKMTVNSKYYHNMSMPVGVQRHKTCIHLCVGTEQEYFMNTFPDFKCNCQNYQDLQIIKLIFQTFVETLITVIKSN